MEVILLEKVDNLGGLGDKVSVKSGYGRNFLIPTGKAITATKSNVAEFEARRAELEKQAAEALTAAEARKVVLEALTVTIARKAGDEGRLFGSVGTADIASATVAAGGQLEKREVRLPDGPFHATGEFDVLVHLHTDVDATIKVVITPEVE
ncbi:50S ribosomal protein L9 [Sedimenticola selenatireducens]|uniref:Large ribosomal subunit protein bL9 n=1 Tax=Sedimenticola selenatireducens TaxID=191960 RepID=A0A557SNN8_9GAMM|nr:50S ribosomal protein L9 [Sedimenticola selenatireducens]TVO79041.1 50S ribosomal protein L9 [Sedimenticola selenatireducens]TVT67167.1 MAG: 50S ribosomal protein L9 [Sedimenticola selenatireducens]